MDNHKISIIVPIYNVEKYISQCLESIINQTYHNLEIILINDGSTDNSGKVCDEYAKQDKRIKVIHQKNQGVSAARNNGIDILTGNYVMFIDPDDWIELNACEVLLRKITESNLDILIYNFYKEYETKTEKHKEYIFNNNDKDLVKKIQAKILAPTIKIPELMGNGFNFTCNKIINAKLVKEQKFTFEGKKAIFEDGIFYYSLLEKTNKVGICNEFLYHYRILNNSAMRRYNKDFIEISKEIVDNIKSKSQYHIDDIYYFQSLYIRIINNFCTLLNVYYNNNDNLNNTKNKIKLIKKEIENEYYRAAIDQVKYKNLNKKLKIYTILLKLKAYFAIIKLNDIEKKLKEKMYKKGSLLSNI